MSKRKLVLANNPLLGGPSLDERAKGGIPYKEVPVIAIQADPNQPRRNFDEEKLQELAESIKLYGVLTPILVRQSKMPGKYEVISGERRFRAAQRAGLSVIPAIVAQVSEKDNQKVLAMQLVENIQRADLAPLERAHAVGALRDAHQLSIREIADQLSISKSAVQRSLELLELPDDLLNALREGASESKVLLLSKIEDPEIRASYLKDLEVLTRSELEKNLEQAKSKGEDNGSKVVNAEDLRIADEMQRSLGLRVKLSRPSPESQSGKVTIEFYSENDLQLVFRKLIAE